MNKKGVASESILTIFVAIFVIFTILVVIFIQTTSRKSSKEIIKEDFQHSDSNQVLLAYLRSNYNENNVLDLFSSLDEKFIRDSSASFFTSLENYWALEIDYNGKKYFFDKPGDYSYERYSLDSKNPSASLVLPDKNDNPIKLNFYNFNKEVSFYG